LHDFQKATGIFLFDPESDRKPAECKSVDRLASADRLGTGGTESLVVME
jgi:hypothetical protein